MGTVLCNQQKEDCCVLTLKNVCGLLTPSLLMVLNKCALLKQNVAIYVELFLYAHIQSLFFPFITGSITSLLSNLHLFVSLSLSLSFVFFFHICCLTSYIP